MLARHEDDKNAAKAFACQQCPKRFTRNDHLERHVESVHEKRKAFECAVCAHQFARKHHLSKHILAVHAKVKPYGCNQCEQSFLQVHSLISRNFVFFYIRIICNILISRVFVYRGTIWEHIL